MAEPKKVMMPVLPMEDLLEWADSQDVKADRAERVLDYLSKQQMVLLSPEIREQNETDILKYRRRGAFLRRVAAAILNARELVEEAGDDDGGA
jgi:hypothetical protein